MPRALTQAQTILTWRKRHSLINTRKSLGVLPGTASQRACSDPVRRHARPAPRARRGAQTRSRPGRTLRPVGMGTHSSPRAHELRTPGLPRSHLLRCGSLRAEVRTGFHLVRLAWGGLGQTSQGSAAPKPAHPREGTPACRPSPLTAHPTVRLPPEPTHRHPEFSRPGSQGRLLGPHVSPPTPTPRPPR